MINITKRLRNILIISSIILLLLLLWGDFFYLTKSDNKELPETLYIINKTDYDFELKTKIILNKIFGYDSIYLKYEYMVEPHYIDGFEVAAHIIKNPMFDNQYFVYISKKIKPYQIDIILSHELVHLDQYESSDLELINIFTGTFKYKGEIIESTLIPYNERPFEIDAYNIEDSIYNQLQILIQEYNK